MSISTKRKESGMLAGTDQLAAEDAGWLDVIETMSKPVFCVLYPSKCDEWDKHNNSDGTVQPPDSYDPNYPYPDRQQPSMIESAAPWLLGFGALAVGVSIYNQAKD